VIDWFDSYSLEHNCRGVYHSDLVSLPLDNCIFFFNKRRLYVDQKLKFGYIFSFVKKLDYITIVSQIKVLVKK